MPDDALPPDVHAVIDQLLEEAGAAVSASEYDTARSAVDSVATVTENKVPPGPQRDLLEHCCETVADLLDADEIEDELVREYLRATRDRLAVADGG